MEHHTDNTLAQMLTMKQAAARLGVSVSTVWKLINTGKLQKFNVGGLGISRVREDDVVQLLQAAA